MCSDFTNIGTPANPSYLIDGNNAAHRALLDSVSTLGIDADCTLKDFPESNPLNLTLINFNFEQQQDFIIVFDNVSYIGGMSCQDPTQSDFWMWWVNGSYNDISSQCQAFVLPVDAIRKDNPAGESTAVVGVPFTYKLTLPQLMLLTDTGYEYQIPVTDDDALSDVHVYDDLTATGADLDYLGNNAYLINSDGTTTSIGQLPNQGTPTNLHFTYSNIPPGAQLVVEVEVVLADSAANVPGTTFSNTATWTFDKTINGIFKDNLTGQNGVSDPMTIVGPNLVVDKSSTASNLNVGTAAPFEIDVENSGGGDAHGARIDDVLPAGMCNYDPTTPDPVTSQPGVVARIAAADGTLVSSLAPGTDYTVAYDACRLSLTLLDTPAARIGPNEHLIINYQAMLDAGVSSGTYTNVAGATRWFNGGGLQYDRTLSDGTPGVSDFQDAYTVTAAVAGYYFLKSVENLTAGTAPASAAFPGDRLRYTLQIQNFTQPTLDVSAITDELDAAFEPGTLSVYAPGTDLPVAPIVDPAGGANGTGAITVPAFTLPENTQFQLQFDVTLTPSLSTGIAVPNQAFISGTYPTGTLSDAPSDDPYANGPTQLLTLTGEPTVVKILAPGPLSKENPSKTTVAIGEQFKYRIAVPAAPVDVPLYDVRILDDLGASAADLRFVSANVVSGGTWSLSNTGTGSSLVIADTATGIDIPAGGQAVIEITVELENTATNQNGLQFSNAASYTYSRVNGSLDPQIAGAADSTDPMSVVEPDAATATKTARFVAPAGKAATDPATVGDVIEYAVTVPNTGSSTAFDTDIVDILPPSVELVAGSATARIDNVAVAGFVVAPTALPGGALAWGRQNGDESLDIPAGQSLVLTYQVTVLSAAQPSIVNSVYVDWTSLEGALGSERTGEGCPTITAPDDYCHVPTPVTVSTLDNTSITKAVVDDSYAETPASSTDPVVRVGDTLSYELTLNLNEYTTRSVVVEDTLPAGMALDSFTIDPGATAFSYALAAQPAAGDTGTLVWDFGDITNPPDGTPSISW